MKTRETLITLYAIALTLAFGTLLFTTSSRRQSNVFDEITVHRINVVEPDGTTRLVISDKARFPGWFFKGKEIPRPDRADAGFLFNDDEGTENGGLIFGGSTDAKGVTHSYGHLSFDNYQRDQVMVLEANNDGPSRHSFYGLNDDDRPNPLTPQAVADYQQAKSQPAGPAREAAIAAWKAKNPGGIVQRGYLGRETDTSVALVLKDTEGHPRLTARVLPNGDPVVEFLDRDGKVLKRLDSTR